jgi:hypothetical protein
MAVPGDHLYCMIMVHPLVSNKNKVRVMLTHLPMCAVALHNQCRTRNRETHHFAPYWRLVLVVGPFALPEHAVCYTMDVMHGTRGPRSKIIWAQELAQQYNVQCRAEDVVMTADEATAYLTAVHAPAAYLDALQELIRAHAVLQTYWDTSSLPALLAQNEGFA